jgi:hypothetical protein
VSKISKVITLGKYEHMIYGINYTNILTSTYALSEKKRLHKREKITYHHERRYKDFGSYFVEHST